MAGKFIAEITRLDLNNITTPESAKISGFQHLTSYNWIEAPKKTPTIAVPGCPDLWSPHSNPAQVRKDTGRFFIAQNAMRHPDSPLEPLFRALYISHPTFEIASIDIVTDRNNIRKLLGFVDPRLSKNKREDFTIHIDIKKDTAVFCREETKTVEYIGPTQNKGYGHMFEKEYTKHQVSGSTGHHRIISYNFGGLNIIVRYETDGYVSDTSSTQPSPKLAKEEASEADKVASILGSLSLATKSKPSSEPFHSASKLVIQEEGHLVPHASILEIKTRIARKRIAFKEVATQLWVSQTPKLVRAYHTDGLFPVPEVEDMTAQVKEWEDSNQAHLRVLAGLMGNIRDIVKENGGRAILKYNAKGDKLVLHKLGGKHKLPSDICAKWDKVNTDKGLD